MKRWLALFLLLVSLAPIQSEAAPISHYFYSIQMDDSVNTSNQGKVLTLTDPSDVSNVPHKIVLPDFTRVCGDPSPDGRYLLLCYQERPYLTTGFMLLDMQSGAVKPIIDVWLGDDDYTGLYQPQWSPDGQYLAFNAHRDGLNRTAIYLYSIGNNQLRILATTLEKVSGVEKSVETPLFRLWSRESKQIAMTERECVNGDPNRCSATRLQVVSIEDAKVLVQIIAPSTDKGYDICRLSWYPRGRYIIFEPYCDFSAGIPYKEVYVWDTLQNSIAILTAYTNPDPDTWTQYPPEKYATYAPFWYDWQTLLLGIQGATLISNGNKLLTDPTTLVARTMLHHINDTEPTLLLDSAVTSWALNPVSGELAFRKQKWTVNADGDRERIQDEVAIARFDGQKLIVSASADGGCNDLSWSPDGKVLAYSIPNEVSKLSDCNSFSLGRIRFLFPDGTVNDYLQPVQVPGTRIGWVRITDTTPTAMTFFPAGTPTPIP